MMPEWKWNFAAQSGLALIIALSTLFFAFVIVYIAPVVMEEHSELGKEAPNYLQAAINVSVHMFRYWYLWMIPSAGGIAMFEWKCKSENKALIRTTVGVGVSLFGVLLLFWVVGVILVSMAIFLH